MVRISFSMNCQIKDFFKANLKKGPIQHRTVISLTNTISTRTTPTTHITD